MRCQHDQQQDPIHSPIVFLSINGTSLGPRHLQKLLNYTVIYSSTLYSTIGTTLSGAPDNYKRMFRKKPMSYILFNLTIADDGMAGEVHYGNTHQVSL